MTYGMDSRGCIALSNVAISFQIGRARDPNLQNTCPEVLPIAKLPVRECEDKHYLNHT